MTDAASPKYWTTWGTARGYSLSPTEERFLLEEFQLFSGEKPERVRKVLPDRQVASLLLTMLRDGVRPNDLEEIAPNLNPQDLEAVYVDIAGKLHSARMAWQDLLAQPEAFDDLADSAARVMPHLVNILRGTEATDRPALISRLHLKVTETTDKINDLEKTLHLTSDPDERYNLHYSLARADSCLWDDVLFLPDRVGQLTPTRLSFTLGELS